MKLILKDKLNSQREPVYEYFFDTWERLAIFPTGLRMFLNKDEYEVEVKYE